MMKRRFALRSTLLLALASSLPGAPSLAQEDGHRRASAANDGSYATAKLEDIALAARALRERVRYVDTVVTLKQRIISGTTPDPRMIPTQRERAVVDLHRRRYHLYQESPYTGPKGEEKFSNIEMAYREGLTTVFLIDFESGTIDDKPEPTMKIEKRTPILAGAMMFSPTPNGAGIDDASLESFLKHGSLRDASEVVDGRTCRVIDALGEANGKKVVYATSWLDLERGAMPLKTQIYDREGKVCIDSRLKDFREVPDGSGPGKIWLPMEIVSKISLKGNVYDVDYVADPERTFVNPPLDDASFVVDFPPGTTVEDKTQKTSFLVPGNRIAKKSLGYVIKVPDAPRAGSSIRLALMAFLGLHLVLFAAYLVFRISRRDPGAVARPG